MPNEPKGTPASSSDLMDKLTALCKQRGIILPGSEIYGGLANSWGFGWQVNLQQVVEPGSLTFFVSW